MHFRDAIAWLSALLVSCFFVAPAAPESLPFGNWKLMRTVPLKGPTNHVQGIEFDAETAWITSVDSKSRKGYLRVFSLSSGDLKQGIEVQQGERFHPGGLAADATSVWIPVAAYRRNSTSTIERRNKGTLALESAFSVNDHIGCVAVDPNYVVGGNWDSRDFYVWDHDGKFVRKVAAKTENSYQDMKFDNGLLVASGVLANGTGAIDWIEFPSFRVVKRLSVGMTDHNAAFTREGMAIHGKQLALLPEDDPSRVFLFALDQ